MIKFRCGHCNQKLGVPDEWGGKRIRCNHCKESCLVPLSQTRPQSQPETAPEADPATVLIQMDLPQEEGGDGFPSHLLDFQSGKVVPREDRPPAPIVPRDAIQVSVRRAELAESRPRWGLSVAAKGTLQIPLAVVVSLGCTLAAAFVWGKVASTVQFRLNILAILVAGAAGLGLVAVLRRQHVGIGIMAAIIGMVGVFSGKWFIGQWLVMPAFQEAVNARIDLMNSLPMSKTGMSDFLDDPEVVQDCICLQLSDNGQITPETAEKLIYQYHHVLAPENNAPEVVQANAMVQKAVDEWTDPNKLRAIKIQFPTLQKTLAQQTMESTAGKTISSVAAFVGAFSLYDLIWLPTCIWVAFRIGAVTEGVPT
jgi:hypothetical protein